MLQTVEYYILSKYSFNVCFIRSYKYEIHYLILNKVRKKNLKKLF